MSLFRTKENGERKSLNVGHTTGHAIELSSELSHGESVLFGMQIETKIAIEQGVCKQEYGKKLLSLIEKALSVSPQSTPDFSQIGQAAEKARADKKNTDDGKIRMSVAQDKGAWTSLALPFETYKNCLIKHVK